jgi:GPH family glycoside/pentoside/hexuronide:cation symporter
MGYRMTALVATIFCLLGGLVFTRYDERATLASIGAGDKE